MQPNRQIDKYFFLKNRDYLYSKSPIWIIIFLVNHLTYFTDEDKPVSEIMYLVQSPLARKMGARIWTQFVYLHHSLPIPWFHPIRGRRGIKWDAQKAATEFGY